MERFKVSHHRPNKTGEGENSRGGHTQQLHTSFSLYNKYQEHENHIRKDRREGVCSEVSVLRRSLMQAMQI